MSENGVPNAVIPGYYGVASSAPKSGSTDLWVMERLRRSGAQDKFLLLFGPPILARTSETGLWGDRALGSARALACGLWRPAKGIFSQEARIQPMNHGLHE